MLYIWMLISTTIIQVWLNPCKNYEHLRLYLGHTHLPTYLSIQPSIQPSIHHLWLYSLWFDLGRFFSLLILYTVGRTPWTGDQPFARPLPTHIIIQTQNKRTQTSMPWVVFEPTSPAFERAKSVHALDRAATVIGGYIHHNLWKAEV
jgi:hypothetical protein